MCMNRWCPCGWPEAEIDEEFTAIFEESYTTKEEAYIDTEPDIAGPLRELDQREQAEKIRRRKQRDSD